MPIPNHLKDIAYSDKSKENFTSFELKCKCGSFLFDLYENYLDKEEKALCKPYEDALDLSVKGGYGSSCTVDEDGKIHHWIHLSFSPNGPKEEVFIPPKPVCACILSIRSKCSECGREYAVYDSRYHGYDSMYDPEISDEEKNYVPHYKKKRRRDNMPVRVCVEVEHNIDMPDEDSGTDLTEAFTWITIRTIDSSGKKRKIFDLETG